MNNLIRITEVPPYKFPRYKFSLVISSLDISFIKSRTNLPRYKFQRFFGLKISTIVENNKVEGVHVLFKNFNAVRDNRKFKKN